MVFLDKLKKQIMGESSDVFALMSSTKLKLKLDVLRKEEKDAVIRLGYEVLARGDATKYGSSGDNLIRIQQEISAVQNQLVDEDKKMKL